MNDVTRSGSPRFWSNWRGNVGIGCVALILLTLLAYLPTLGCGFVWDDDAFVIKNQALRSLSGLFKLWFVPGTTTQYYPLTYSTLWVEYQLWELSPMGYHVVNVLLHAAVAVLLWHVLRRLGIAGAWCAAAVFAVHPVMVESVVWISERKNVLSGLFYFLAMLTYMRFWPLTGPDDQRRNGLRQHLLLLVLFACALLSKTVTCTLPAVLLLLVWWKRGRLRWRDVRDLAPLFVLGAGFGMVTVWMEKHTVGAIGAEWSLSLIERFLVAGRALWFYVGKLLWPHPLIFIYPKWNVDAAAAWQYLFPAMAAGAVFFLWFARQRIGRGPLVAVLCFAGTLFPALGFFDVYPFRFSYVADHFQYLASIGIITLGVGGSATLLKRTDQWWRSVCGVVVAIGLLLLGFSTWNRVHAYKDLETFWRDVLAKNPSAWLANNNLGVTLGEQGLIQEAIAHYRKALESEPEYPEAHNNLGFAQLRLGQTSEAIRNIQESIRLKPGYADAHNNLGIALAGANRTEEALRHLQEALRLVPDYPEAHNNMGIVLTGVGRLPEAIVHFEQAIRQRPGFTEATENLAAVRKAYSRGTSGR